MARLQNVFMLAKPILYSDLETWSSFQWGRFWVEPKIDGVRFLRYKGKWISSGGKRLYNVEHITRAIDSIPGIDRFIIDGELHGDDWEHTISVAHTKRLRKSCQVSYTVFDCVPLIGDIYSTVRLDDRREMLTKFLGGIDAESVRIVKTHHVQSLYEFNLVHEQNLADGCDGSILKRMESIYVPKRSADWLKVKPVTEVDCKIVDFKPGQGKYKGTLGSVGVVIPRGEGQWSDAITYISGMTDAERKQIWKSRQKLLGTIMEVKYRAISKDERLKEPRIIRLRPDKRL